MQSDVYGSNDARNARAANLNKANIEKDFIYPKIKNYLK